ncbi:MAG: tetratricopeptide repeat protein, partial [Prochlorotrichaceae cyanobacterium]
MYRSNVMIMLKRSLVFTFTSLFLIGLVQLAREADPNSQIVQEHSDRNTSTLAQTDPRLAEADRLDQQVRQLYQQGRYEEGIAIAQQVLEIRESILGDHPDTATILLGLGLGYSNMGRYSEAEPLYQRSLSIREQQLGADHPDTATSL